jgi:hypothetical protein
VIRTENRFWRALTRRQRCHSENFFIAKLRDSESAHLAFLRRQRVAMTLSAR